MKTESDKYLRPIFVGIGGGFSRRIIGDGERNGGARWRMTYIIELVNQMRSKLTRGGNGGGCGGRISRTINGSCATGGGFRKRSKIF